MSLRSRLDLEVLADTGRHLQGRFDAGALDARVAAALDRDAAHGKVWYTLEFARLPNGEVGMHGRIAARLGARCQRCLEPFELQVKATPRVQLSAAADGAQPQEGWEAGDTGAAPRLAALIEDELLLVLPFAPRHAVAQCPAHVPGDAPVQPQTRRPFADLARTLAERGGRKD